MLSMSDAMRVLETRGWLTQTTPAFRDMVIASCALRCVERNTDIYHAGDEPGGLWGLADGALLIDFPGPDSGPHSAPILIHYATPGFWIGEGSVLTGGPRLIGIRAAQDCTLLRLPRNAFLEITNRDPQAWRWLGLLVLEHTVSLMKTTTDLRIPMSRRRVAAILSRMGTPLAGEDRALGAAVEIFVNQGQLADFAGLSRAAVAEALRELAALGIVEPGYRRLIVHDLAALSRIGSGLAVPNAEPVLNRLVPSHR
jgi:CRP/FNR family transcriptional regulator, cyclic AMP receptor protein